MSSATRRCCRRDIDVANDDTLDAAATPAERRAD